MNKTIKFVMALLITGLALFAMTGTAVADEYYVSTSGDNSNSGTSLNQAFCTVEYGSGKLAPGDTLYIDGGTYWNDKIRFERSGTASNWITVTNYNNEKVKMYHTESVNSDSLIHLVDRSHIKIENIESSHYNECCYISGKYRGDTHDLIINNVDSLRSYSRGYACNGGAFNIEFTDILIKDVRHPSSSPNGFDFLTSPHDENYNPNSDYMIHDITLTNVDIDNVESHNGFNFGQGVSGVNYDEHWEKQLCNNLHFIGCDVKDVSDQAYFSNKYILHNSVIEDCTVSGCFNAFGVGGNNLRFENIKCYDNSGNDIYLPWDTKSYDIVVKCFDGDLSDIDDENEVTIIPCETREAEIADEEEEDWMEEYIGEDSDEGEKVTTVELQHAFHHWVNNIPVRDHLITTEDLQYLIVLWQE